MALLPLELLLVVNAALLGIAVIIAIALLRIGILYVRNIGDSDKQGRQKTVILWLIMLLLFISVAAAVINILSSPI